MISVSYHEQSVVGLLRAGSVAELLLPLLLQSHRALGPVAGHATGEFLARDLVELDGHVRIHDLPLGVFVVLFVVEELQKCTKPETLSCSLVFLGKAIKFRPLDYLVLLCEQLVLGPGIGIIPNVTAYVGLVGVHNLNLRFGDEENGRHLVSLIFSDKAIECVDEITSGPETYGTTSSNDFSSRQMTHLAMYHVTS